MFDVGFSEMVVIGLVALVVIGPERLPRVARTLGVLFGRMQRYVTQVKADINREIEASDLSKVKTDLESAARSFKSEVEGHAAQVQEGVREMQSTVEREAEAARQGIALSGSTSEASPSSGTPASDAADSAHAPEAPSPQLELDIDETHPPGPTRPA